MLKLAVVSMLTFGTVVHATELPAPAEERFQQDVAWSPDGQHLAYSEFSGGEFKPEKWSVWVARSDGSQRRELARHATYVTWSPDGRRVAYGAERGEGWGLFATSLDSGITECFTDVEHKDRQPAWSPDGTRLAFVSNRGGVSQLFVLNIGTGDLVQLTHDSLKDYNPQWSPSSDRIVFYREKPVGHDDIYVVAPDGSQLAAVTSDSALDMFPSFHPQGGVVFSSKASKDAGKRLVHAALDGSERRDISDISTFFARVSPDGQRIAFISGEWPKSAVYIFNVTDSTVTKIIN